MFLKQSHLLFFAVMNECNLGMYNCHADATCQDMTIGYDCVCNEGFSGDGQLCTGNKMLCMALKKLNLYGTISSNNNIS